MKSIPAVFALMAGAIGSGAASAGVADAEANPLLAKYSCQACHSTDKKILGPAFKDIAAKYAGDSSAAVKLAQKVKSGGSGVWGPVPMPANNVPDADLGKMIDWILALK